MLYDKAATVWRG